jgi:hypothetical protein
MDTLDTKTINLRDLPEDLVRRAKACAALHGMTLRDFVMRAIVKATEEDLPAFPGRSTMPMAATVVHDKKQRKRTK